MQIFPGEIAEEAVEDLKTLTTDQLTVSGTSLRLSDFTDSKFETMKVSGQNQ